MHTRARRRNFKRVEIAQELELMPMLNVFISIIPLLLLSAAFVQLAVIPTSLPADAVATPVAHSEVTPLHLSIVIGADAYVVRANGTEMKSIARPQPSAKEAVTAARTELQQVLAAIAAEHPDHREVRIVAEATTRYEDIIDVMDVSRAAGLPEAALADATQGAW